jgi:hypothetical protein
VPFDDLNSSAPQVAIKKISQWESPSRVLVAEMMILAGEVVGALGTAAALPLPYRGQAAPELPPEEELAEYPEGPCKGYRLRRWGCCAACEAQAQKLRGILAAAGICVGAAAVLVSFSP